MTLPIWQIILIIVAAIFCGSAIKRIVNGENQYWFTIVLWTTVVSLVLIFF